MSVEENRISILKKYVWTFDTSVCEVNENVLQSEDGRKGIHEISNNDVDAKTNYNGTKKNRSLDQIACMKPVDSMKQFVQEALLNSTFRNTTIIGQGRKFLSVVYKALLKMSVQPVAIRKSQGLVRLVSNTNNIRFITIDTFLPKDFKSIYEDHEGAVYYPYCANHPDLNSLKSLKTNHFIRYFHKSCRHH